MNGTYKAMRGLLGVNKELTDSDDLFCRILGLEAWFALNIGFHKWTGSDDTMYNIKNSFWGFQLCEGNDCRRHGCISLSLLL